MMGSGGRGLDRYLAGGAAAGGVADPQRLFVVRGEAITSELWRSPFGRKADGLASPSPSLKYPAAVTTTGMENSSSTMLCFMNLTVRSYSSESPLPDAGNLQIRRSRGRRTGRSRPLVPAYPPRHGGASFVSENCHRRPVPVAFVPGLVAQHGDKMATSAKAGY